MEPILVGAVLYDPKVSIIWDIIRDYFEARDVPIDVVFFSNYSLQVKSHLAGAVEVAWNSPLAWLDAQRRTHGGCRAIAMRDTDRDRKSHIVVRRDGGPRSVAELRGQTVACGAADSPQATLIPREHLRRAGLPQDAYTLRRFDVAVGKHGDHVGGEREALSCLERGESAASCLIDLNWNTWIDDGTIDPGRFALLSTTEPYDHCVFTVKADFPREREEQFLSALLSMDYGDPAHRQMMDMEGLRRWEPGRTTGFALLTSACEHQRFFQGT